MPTTPRIPRLASALLAAAALLVPVAARAHCDRLDGPVAEAAREALSEGSFQAVQIWVAEAQEAELREAFGRAAAAVDDGAEAAALAERYLIETAVRLHRQSEGMAYDGVKPAGLAVPPDIRLGDEALETGDLAPVHELLAGEMRHKAQELFDHARHARARRNESVEAGREWVDAYVRYIVFVHGLQQAIEAGPEHGVGHVD